MLHAATCLCLGLTAPIEAPARILVFTVSAGFQHHVVRPGEKGGLSLVERAMSRLGRETGAFEAIVTRDPSWFTRENLTSVDGVFFYTTGELPFAEGGREALIEFVRDGGAFLGAHSASDTFYEFAPYGEMIGGYFDGHPWHESVRVRVEDRQHPATRHLGESFEITDEIYQFKAPYDRTKLHVLMSLDISAVDMQRKGIHRTDGDFALAWCRDYGKGRVFYTALGHRPEVWEDTRFLDHLEGGIRWALGRTEKRSSTPEPSETEPEAPDPQEAYRSAAEQNPGRADRGRELFFDAGRAMCARCHAVGSEGGDLGPDLAGIGTRASREELMSSVLDPSAVIAPEWRAHSLELVDGTMIFGKIVEQQEKVLTLIDPDGESHRIPLEQVAKRRESRLSVMPAGLEALLSPTEFSDLIAYLASLR